MKLTTTFWEKEKFDFYELLYINGKTDEIVFKTNLHNKWETHFFFKNVAKHAQKENTLTTYDKHGFPEAYFQFAIINKGEIAPIVWFDLVINDSLTVSHDKAFSTELVVRNGIRMPFGKFPMRYQRRLPVHREFKMKSRVMKFFANQALKGA